MPQQQCQNKTLRNRNVPKNSKKIAEKKRNLRNTAGFVDGESHFAVVVSVVILTDSFGLNPFWIDDRFRADEPVGE